MISAVPSHPAERPEPAIKASSAPGISFTMGRSARSGRSLLPANRRASPMVSGARARRSPSHPLGSESSGCVLKKHVCKTRTQISSPASLLPNRANAEGYDGNPSEPMDCAGGAKMHGLNHHAGRARIWRGSNTKQSRAVTLFPSSGRSSPCGLDATGPEAAHFLLRVNLRAFFPRGNRISPQPAHVRQDPPRCMTDVFEALRGFVSAAAFHVEQHGASNGRDVGKAFRGVGNV